MTTLQPPTPAWPKGRSDDHSVLDTRMPSHLRRRGYRATWPAGEVVQGVEGIPTDLNTTPGSTRAVNTDTGTLYRRDPVDGWVSANGEV